MATYSVTCPSLIINSSNSDHDGAIINESTPDSHATRTNNPSIIDTTQYTTAIHTLFKFDNAPLANYLKKAVKHVYVRIYNVSAEKMSGESEKYIGGTIEALNTTFNESTVTWNNTPSSRVLFLIYIQVSASSTTIGTQSIEVPYYQAGYSGYDGQAATRSLYAQLPIGIRIGNHATSADKKNVNYYSKNDNHAGSTNVDVLVELEDWNPALTVRFPTVGAFVKASIVNTFSVSFDAFDSINYPTAQTITYEIKDTETSAVTSYTASVSINLNGRTYIEWTVPAGTLENGKDYQWHAKITTDDGTTGWSGWADFTTKDAIPGQPTIVSPQAKYLIGSDPTTLSWQHNIATGSAQHAYDLQYKQAGSWTDIVVNEVSADQSYTVPEGFFSAGQMYWRVRTYNTDDVAGDWGTSSANVVQAKPETPILSQITSAPRLSASWQSVGQQAYRFTVANAAGKIVYDSGDTYGVGKTITIDDYLPDGNYTVSLKIQNGLGMWSDPAISGIAIQNTPQAGEDVITAQSIFGGVRIDLGLPNTQQMGNPLTYENIPEGSEFDSAIVNGETEEIGNGEKGPDNPYALNGTTKLTSSDGGENSQEIDFDPLYSVGDQHDTLDLLTGERTMITELHQLDETAGWEYDPESLSSYGGDTLDITDAQEGGELTKLEVEGETVQDGSGTPSPDNVRPLHGVQQITLSDGGNQSQTIALPQPLYSLPDGTADEIEAVSGQEAQRIGKAILNGSTGTWLVYPSSESALSICFYASGLFSNRKIPSSSNTSICDKFLYSSNIIYSTSDVDEGYYPYPTIADRHAIRILKSRLVGWLDTWTDAQKVAAFKAWLAANPVTILYELAAPVAIVGTPQAIATYAHTIVTTDIASNLSATYVNNGPALYVRCQSTIARPQHCTHFKDQPYDDSWYDGQQGIGVDGARLYLKVPKAMAKTLSEFLLWIATQTIQFLSLRSEPLSSQEDAKPVPIYYPTTILTLDRGAMTAARTVVSAEGTRYILRDNKPIAKITGTIYVDHTASGVHEYIFRIVTEDGNYYDTNAVTASPLIRYACISKFETPNQILLLKFGEGQPPQRSNQSSKIYSSNHFAGRALPVHDVTEQHDSAWEFSYSLLSREDYLGLYQLFLDGETVLFRDSRGYKAIGTMTSIKPTPTRKTLSVSFTIEESDVIEGIDYD